MALEDFLNHEEQSVRQAAQILIEAQQDPNLTQSEFEEIADDVLEVHEMQKLADTLDRKIAIQAAVDIMLMLIKKVKL